MSLVDRAVRLMARRRLRALRRQASNPRDVQLRVLRQLLRSGRVTDFGRQHDFQRLRAYEDYKAAVPLRDYTAHAPYWQLAREGQESVSWPGHIRHWAISSGTTAGEKFLPVSRDTIRGNKRGGFDALVPFLAQDPRPLFSGKLLFLGGSTALRREGPSWIGDNTGIMQREIPSLVRRMHVPSSEIASMGDWEAKIEAAAKECLDADLRLLSGVPSWILLFCERVLELARVRWGDTITLAEIWPRLACFVHGGVTFAPYRNRFEELAGTSVTCIDTYSASEGGMLGVQDQLDDPSMLPILDTGTFFEFVPAEEIHAPSPTRLAIDAVETDVDYAVVLTTDSGIWSYVLGDLVRFTSRDPLRFLFAGRIAHTLNAFGEHISSGELDRAVAIASEKTKSSVVEYAVATQYPSSDAAFGHHVYYCEFHEDPPRVEDFVAAIDTAIARGNEDYETHRSYGLSGPELRVVERGGFEAWMRSRGKLGGQNKVPRVLASDAEAELRGYVRSSSTGSHEEHTRS